MDSDPLSELPEELNRNLLLAYMQTPLECESARLGPGAMVHRDYARAMGRLHFFFAMHRMKPEVCHSLCNDEAVEAAAKGQLAWQASRPQLDAMMNAHQAVMDLLEVGPIKPALREALRRGVEASAPWLESEAANSIRCKGKMLSAHVWAWQERWNLLDDWIADAAYLTLDFAGAASTEGYWFDGPIALDMDSLHARHEVMVSEQHNAVTIDLGSFDLGSESVSGGADRIIRDIARPQILESLNELKKEAVARLNAVSTMAFRSTSAFEWLVRYQVFGESKNAIAKDVGKDRGHVTREVNRAAELIGMTLRT